MSVLFTEQRLAGDAVFAGADDVSSGTVNCRVGSAVAQGRTAGILLSQSVSCSVGNAVAAGFTVDRFSLEQTLTQADLDAIANAVWDHADAVAAHARLDAILAILQAG